MVSDLPSNYEFFFHFLASQKSGGPHCKVLDYGCGSGLVVREGIKRGYQMFGVDNFYQDDVNAEVALTHAQSDSLPIRRLNPDGSIPWPDGYFDVIISNQVIEHVANLDLIVREMHRVLRGGGRTSCFPNT